MIFRFLGQVVRRFWVIWLAAWVILVLGTWLAAPPWSEVAQAKEFSFLPANIPSRLAEEKFRTAFPAEKAGSNIVLLLHRTETDPATFKGDLDFIARTLEPGLTQLAQADGGLAYEIKASEDPLFSDEEPAKPKQAPKRSIIARIRTPNAPGTGALGVSPDRKAMLVVLDLTPEFTSNRTWHTIDQVEALLTKIRQKGLPPGLEILLTGSAVIGRDNAEAELSSVRATGLLTVVLVAGLLIVIYRAPLLAVIPLFTVFLAVQVSLNVLAILGRAELINLFDGLQIYITILAYGAGVDYCLFLTARYKEELDAGVEPSEAVARSIGGVGSALAASAATVICGIAMMMFAEFGKFRDAGFAIPLTILLVLVATLTFSPSLLCLAGRWAFWPQRRRPAAVSNLRDQAASTLGDGAPSTNNAVVHPHGDGKLVRLWEHVGELLLRRAGTVWLVTVAVMAPFAIAALLLNNHLSYDLVGDLPADATSVAGTRLLLEKFPAGIVGPVSVLLVDPSVDFGREPGQTLIAKLTDRLRDDRKQLGLADVRSLTAPLGITPAATEDFSGLDLPQQEREDATKRAARDYYLTDMGVRGKTGTRLELILDRSPFSRQSIAALSGLEQAIRSALSQNPEAQIYVVGTTASIRDLSAVMQRDRRRIELLVVASVFVILVVLLRQFIVPLYLLLSVLFSYFTAMGVTFAVFYLADPAGFTGIDWRVAIFLFTILIAVGEDYNIFLMTRIHEEQRRFGPIRGITEALDRTGPIISSCGIIMAGTFASLLIAGALTEMKQLGFALSFGVLLDTFVVRPILVPSFLILLHRTWPRFAGGHPEPAPAQPAMPPAKQPSS